MMQFHFTIIHVSGKNLVTTDPSPTAAVHGQSLYRWNLNTKEAEAYFHLIMNSMPATEKKLTDIRASQDKDEICLQVKKYVQNG